MKKPIYTVHAYRFGDRERHSYIVGLYSDETIALFEAEREEIWRGGKYECEVCEWILDAPSADSSPGMTHRVVKALPAVSTLVSRGRFGKSDMINFMIGQRVILTQQGGAKEIGTVVPSETGVTRGVWVMSPSRGYASDYDKHNVQPLPNGQL